MQVKKVGVIGAGIMGSGIAQIAAAAGYNVVLRDLSEDALERGMAAISKSLDRMEAKKKISAEDRQATLGRIETTTELARFAEVDLSIEAIVENTDVKAKVFGELQQLCREDAILASNTSSIALTKIAGTVERPERVVGMHFFNPVPVMELVEVIRALQTSD